MKEPVVSFNTARLAKEKGFFLHQPERYVNERLEYSPCRKYVASRLVPMDKNQIFAPTQSLLQMWLREVHSIAVEVLLWSIDDIKKEGYCYQWRVWDGTEDWQTVFIEYNTYESAMEEALLSALNLIKTTKNA